MSATITQTSKNSKQIKEENIDKVLENVKKVDNTCKYTKCKNRINDFAIDCKFCKNRYCITHGLPEIHGCGEAVRREEKREFLHPNTKLSKSLHEGAQTKLTMKLHQMQLERKSKQGKQKKK